ncbi:hypothetical protein [Clostridium oceanicum]|uniref:ABC transporter permease n=1 Tax=Clostridium oceanicum TaxID=1543 RepID=A0ABP3UYF8_9CLOT
MIKLIKNEFKNFNFKKYIIGVIIANIVLLGFLSIITYPMKYLGLYFILDYKNIFTFIDSLVRAIFMMFSSVLISNIIIKKLKNNKKALISSGRMDREKVIVPKIIFIVLLTFLTMILSNVFLEVSFYFIDKSNNLVPNKLNVYMIEINTINIFIYAITSTLMNLISMYLGIVRESTFVTILTSIVLVCVVCSYNNGFSLNSIIIIPLLLATLGVISAYLSIKHIENLKIAKQ